HGRSLYLSGRGAGKELGLGSGQRTRSSYLLEVFKEAATFSSTGRSSFKSGSAIATSTLDKILARSRGRSFDARDGNSFAQGSSRRRRLGISSLKSFSTPMRTVPNTKSPSERLTFSRSSFTRS